MKCGENSNQEKFYWYPSAKSTQVLGNKQGIESLYRVDYTVGKYSTSTPDTYRINEPDKPMNSDWFADINANSGDLVVDTYMFSEPAFEVVLTTSKPTPISGGLFSIFLNVNCDNAYWLFSPLGADSVPSTWNWQFKPQQGMKWLAKPVVKFLTQTTNLAPSVQIYVEQAFDALVNNFTPKEIRFSFTIACFNDPANPPIKDVSWFRVMLSGFLSTNNLVITPRTGDSEAD
jgi:hypothetical protein